MGTAIGIDPGRKYCGFVVVKDGELFMRHTIPPEDVPGALMQWLDPFFDPVVGIEGFQLFPRTAWGQYYSSMPEVELIGVVKYMCRQQKVPCAVIRPARRSALEHRHPKPKGLDRHQYAAYLCALAASTSACRTPITQQHQ